jgi:hypothetical protein
MSTQFSNTFTVGLYKCKMAFDPASKSISSEWTPTEPERLTDAELKQYRAGRNALLSEIGKALGGNVLVIET